MLAEHLAASSDDLVFTAPERGPLRYSNFRNRVWLPALSTLGAGLPKVLTPHHLRHSCASLLIREGATIKAVQMQLGHGSPMVTLPTYTHLFEGDLDRLYDRLDETYRESLTASRRPGDGLGITDLSDRRAEYGR